LVGQAVGNVVQALSPAERRRPIRSLRYALATVIVLAAVAVVVFLWHRSPAKPLTDQDILVLADFTNNTGEPVFDGTPPGVEERPPFKLKIRRSNR
jgi:hypothetical protein